MTFLVGKTYAVFLGTLGEINEANGTVGDRRIDRKHRAQHVKPRFRSLGAAGTLHLRCYIRPSSASYHTHGECLP